MVRGTGAASYIYLATVYTTLGIRAHPTGPARPEGAPGLVPRPGQARLFVLWGALDQSTPAARVHFWSLVSAVAMGSHGGVVSGLQRIGW
jgi:hypothetical protein